MENDNKAAARAYAGRTWTKPQVIKIGTLKCVAGPDDYGTDGKSENGVKAS